MAYSGRLTRSSAPLLIAAIVSLAGVSAHAYAARLPFAGRPEQTAGAGAKRPRSTATGTRTKAEKPSTTPAAAWSAFYAGDLERATVLAKETLASSPGHTGARLVLARVAMARGDAEAAYLELRRAQLRAPNEPDILYYLALVAGDLARGAFESLYAAAPDSARVHQLMAESFEAQDLKSEAETEYEAALRAEPNLVDALLALAKLKRIRLACDEAISLYERAEAVRPTFDGAFGLGTCRSVQQEDEQAIVKFKEALAIDPRSALAWSGLGTALARSGHSTEGIAALQRAVAIEPRLTEAHYAMGLAYRRIGDEERARGAFEKARDLQAGER